MIYLLLALAALLTAALAWLCRGERNRGEGTCPLCDWHRLGVREGWYAPGSRPIPHECREAEPLTTPHNSGTPEVYQRPNNG